MRIYKVKDLKVSDTLISKLKREADLVYKTAGNTDRDKILYGTIGDNSFKIKHKILYPFYFCGEFSNNKIFIGTSFGNLIFSLYAFASIIYSISVFISGETSILSLLGNILWIFILIAFIRNFIKIKKWLYQYISS